MNEEESETQWARSHMTRRDIINRHVRVTYSNGHKQKPVDTHD